MSSSAGDAPAPSDPAPAASTSPYVPPEQWEPRELPDAWGRETLQAMAMKPWTQEALPKGQHGLQLYSLGTPNGIKVTIFLEELVEILDDFEYDAWWIDIMKGQQYSRGFLEVNPNAHIPCLLDTKPGGDTTGSEEGASNMIDDIRIFESNAILLYLADKFEKFVPSKNEPSQLHDRTECLNWLFWQSGAFGPACGNFNSAFVYSKPGEKNRDEIDRTTLEVKRLLSVLENQLNRDRSSDEPQLPCSWLASAAETGPSIADFCVFPWLRTLRRRDMVKKWLRLEEDYPALIRWFDLLLARPAVQRGIRVNNVMEPNGVKNRHARTDFDAL
ncbi:unnamed protein product [Amoebophrya sp. A120]|nr:unnamed protein product [Amoebophrya sp. A120]|eukprot:GSA120T00018218001.1